MNQFLTHHLVVEGGESPDLQWQSTRQLAGDASPRAAHPFTGNGRLRFSGAAQTWQMVLVREARKPIAASFGRRAPTRALATRSVNL